MDVHTSADGHAGGVAVRRCASCLECRCPVTGPVQKRHAGNAMAPRFPFSEGGARSAFPQFHCANALADAGADRRGMREHFAEKNICEADIFLSKMR